MGRLADFRHWDRLYCCGDHLGLVLDMKKHNMTKCKIVGCDREAAHDNNRHCAWHRAYQLEEEESYPTETFYTGPIKVGWGLSERVSDEQEF